MRVQNLIILSIKALANFFVGRECAVCGRELMIGEEHLCIFCRTSIPLSYSWSYRDNAAERLFWGRVKVEWVLPLMFYTGEYKRCIHSIKYMGNTFLALYLGRFLGGIIASEYQRVEGSLKEKIDYIIPVPLHLRKKIKRGYNQSEFICRGIIRGIKEGGVAPPALCTKLLMRKVFTPTQTKRGRIERWRNVEYAFALRHRSLKKFKKEGRKLHFLLVDDVLTTGATLEACAQTLLKNMECSVSIATLAYVG